MDSNQNISVQIFKNQQDKKCPFLRTIPSCLVLHSYSVTICTSLKILQLHLLLHLCGNILLAMGNCSLKGVVTAKSSQNFIRIMMDSGNILKLEGPKLVQQVVNDFPGYGLFRQGRLTMPLSDQEQLLRGHTYYLLPLGDRPEKARGADGLNAKSLNEVDPVRISSAALDLVTNLANGSGLEVLAPPQKGVWRVKLVINTKQLEEILSEEVNTEALIEQMRMAAASGNVTPRRNKSYWGVSLKPILCNVFKVPVDHQQNEVEPVDLCISSPIKG